MSADLHAIAERIKKATVPEDVFGAIGGTSAKERLREVKGIYRHTALAMVGSGELPEKAGRSPLTDRL